MAQQLWHCDYCDFEAKSQTIVQRHEKRCSLNPANIESSKQLKCPKCGLTEDESQFKTFDATECTVVECPTCEHEGRWDTFQIKP